MLTVLFLSFALCAAITAGEQVQLALRRAGIAVKEAVFVLRVSEPHLYAFFRGERPLDIRRLDALPPVFHEQFDEIRVRARGGFVVHDERLARLLECVDEFAMAKADLRATAAKPVTEREEVAS